MSILRLEKAFKQLDAKEKRIRDFYKPSRNEFGQVIKGSARRHRFAQFLEEEQPPSKDKNLSLTEDDDSDSNDEDASFGYSDDLSDDSRSGSPVDVLDGTPMPVDVTVDDPNAKRPDSTFDLDQEPSSARSKLASRAKTAAAAPTRPADLRAAPPTRSSSVRRRKPATPRAKTTGLKSRGRATKPTTPLDKLANTDFLAMLKERKTDSAKSPGPLADQVDPSLREDYFRRQVLSESVNTWSQVQTQLDARQQRLTSATESGQVGAALTARNHNKDLPELFSQELDPTPHIPGKKSRRPSAYGAAFALNLEHAHDHSLAELPQVTQVGDGDEDAFNDSENTPGADLFVAAPPPRRNLDFVASAPKRESEETFTAAPPRRRSSSGSESMVHTIPLGMTAPPPARAPGVSSVAPESSSSRLGSKITSGSPALAHTSRRPYPVPAASSSDLMSDMYHSTSPSQTPEPTFADLPHGDDDDLLVESAMKMFDNMPDPFAMQQTGEHLINDLSAAPPTREKKVSQRRRHTSLKRRQHLQARQYEKGKQISYDESYQIGPPPQRPETSEGAPPPRGLPRSEVDRTSKEFYYLNVKVVHDESLHSWRFKVVLTDVTMPDRPTHVFRNVRVNKENYIVFHEPGDIILSPLDDFDWVVEPMDMFGHGLRIEVYAIVPTRTRVVDSCVFFGDPEQNNAPEIPASYSPTSEFSDDEYTTEIIDRTPSAMSNQSSSTRPGSSRARSRASRRGTPDAVIGGTEHFAREFGQPARAASPKRSPRPQPFQATTTKGSPVPAFSVNNAPGEYRGSTSASAQKRHVADDNPFRRDRRRFDDPPVSMFPEQEPMVFGAGTVNRGAPRGAEELITPIATIGPFSHQSVPRSTERRADVSPRTVYKSTKAVDPIAYRELTTEYIAHETIGPSQGGLVSPRKRQQVTRALQAAGPRGAESPSGIELGGTAVPLHSLDDPPSLSRLGLTSS